MATSKHAAAGRRVHPEAAVGGRDRGAAGPDQLERALEVGGPAPTTSTSPRVAAAAKAQVPAAIRSGTTACSVGRSDGTPSISTTEEPAPLMRAPIETSISAMSTISGSRAAFSRRVAPRPAQRRSGRSRSPRHWGTPAGSRRRRRPPGASATRKPWVTWTWPPGPPGPPRAGPAPRPDGVATRDRHVGCAAAGDERAEHRCRGAQRPDQVVVGPVADLVAARRSRRRRRRRRSRPCSRAAAAARP